MNKRTTKLTIDPILLDEVKALGINLSSTLEASLRIAVRQRKAEHWLEENRVTLDNYDSWIAQNGLPLETERLF